MTDNDTIGAVVGDGAVGALLRLLAERVPSGLAMLVSRQDERCVVEEAWPPSAGAGGRAIAMPPGLLNGRPVSIDVAETRISVAWTELAGARPTHIAAVPVPGQALHLVLAGVSAAVADTATLASVAPIVGQLLDHGRTTTRHRDTSRRMHALIDNLPVPLVFVDSRTIEVFLNDEARRLLGVTAAAPSERTIAAALAKLIAGSGEDRRPHLSLDPTANLAFEIRHDGRCHEVESRWIDEERLTGRLWLFRDVSDERQVARLKDELVSTVSHELRTPLTSIIGALTLIKEGKAGELPVQAAGLATVAFRNGMRLMRLVDDLLDFDRLAEGKQQFHLRPIELIELLRESIEQNRPYGDRHGVRLELDAPDLPVVATLDPDRIAQVMSNLISNAVKFSPRDSFVVVRLIAGRDAARISVIDRGPGISEAFRARLFTRFAQEHGQSMPAMEGSSGLGLAISKAIVTQHGGAISADANVAVGATFHVDLPLRAGTTIASAERNPFA